MNITHRFVDDCAIIDLFDDQFEYPKSLLLKNHALQLLQEGYKNLALNLTNVTQLDSFGVAAMLSVLKHCKAQKGNLVLFGLNESVTHLMELVHMDRVLDIWETEVQALHQLKVTK